MSFEKILTAISAIIALVIGVFIKGRSVGKSKAKNQYDAKIIKRQTEVARQAKEVDNETNKKGDDAINAELKRDWVRK